MDDFHFFGSFTVSAFSNGTRLVGIHHGECPRQHEGAFMAFLLFMMLFALGVKLILEREATIIDIEIAPNAHADFLDRIRFSGKVPDEYVCSIMQCIMQDPVRIDGGHESHVFERTALEKWINEGASINPLSREPLLSETKLIPADDIAEEIQTWVSDLRLRRQVFSIWSHGKIASAETTDLLVLKSTISAIINQ